LRPTKRPSSNDEGELKSTQASDTSIRNSIVVEAPIERAFSVFTDGFGSFKPPHVGLEDGLGDGPGWEAERDGVGGDQGWQLYLDRFAEQVNACPNT
jgi:hypothetical protein